MEENQPEYQNYQKFIEKLDSIFEKLGGRLFVPKMSVDIIVDQLYPAWKTCIGFITGGEDFSLARRSVNTAILTAAIAETLKLPAQRGMQMVEGALLHDIGMIHIPETILNKTEAISEAEHRYILVHPLHAHKILEKDLRYNSPAAITVVLQHHERMDGTGYPRGLSGDDIDLGARLVAVADAFTGMTSRRAYREALSVSQALQTLSENAGCFDPDALKALEQVITPLEIRKYATATKAAVESILEYIKLLIKHINDLSDRMNGMKDAVKTIPSSENYRTQQKERAALDLVNDDIASIAQASQDSRNDIEQMLILLQHSMDQIEKNG